jgi:hypothetical protein
MVILVDMVMVVLMTRFESACRHFLVHLLLLLLHSCKDARQAVALEAQSLLDIRAFPIASCIAYHTCDQHAGMELHGSLGFSNPLPRLPAGWNGTLRTETRFDMQSVRIKTQGGSKVAQDHSGMCSSPESFDSHEQHARRQA